MLQRIIIWGALAALLLTANAQAQTSLPFPFNIFQQREAEPPLLLEPPYPEREAVVRPRRIVKECREPNPEDYNNDTIIIVISCRTLYHIDAAGQRYTHRIGVPEPQNDDFRGEAVVGRMEEWPGWRPTEEMIRKKPHYAEFRGGMPGGIKNPLGARAIYLYVKGHDTKLRIHGTNNPHTIGEEVSSGCFRLKNAEVMKLYERVRVGTKVVVLN